MSRARRSGARPVPPRLATLLIAATAPADGREEILGDLYERFAIRWGVVGAPRARLWFWAQALRAASHFGFRRVARGAPAPRGVHSRRKQQRPPQRTVISSMLQDLKYAFRSLARAPGFTFVAMLTLALGIGATTAIFSVVNAVVLRPLPYPEPERLVRIFQTDRGGGRHSTSDPNFLDFREQNRTFEDLATISLDNLQATLLGAKEPERLSSASATGSLFTILGVDPVLGRNFSAEEERPGGDPNVVLMSHELWQRRFGGDAGIVGTKLNLDGEPWTVVGVLPASFDFFTHPDVWLPFIPDPEFPRGDHRIEAFGRLLPGVSLERARADLEAIAARLGREYVEFDADGSVELLPFPEWLVGPDVEQVALVLMFAVGLLLLLACANVSNLLITQATGRRREIGLRAALGAGRGRIVRQLLTESVVLAVPGALLGLALALWAVPVVGRLSADALPRIDEVSVDATVLAFTFAATLLTGLVFGSVPALHALRGGLHATLQGGTRGDISGASRLRDGLVVGQIALAMMLLVGAGLLANSFVRLLRVDPGFDSENVLTAEINLPVDRYSEGSPEAVAFYRDVLERIESLPAVTSAAATMVNPFRGWNPSNEVAPPETLEQSEFVRIGWRGVTHGFFGAMGVPLLRGRVFDKTDANDLVVVISAALAERLWPGEDPIDKQLRWNSPRGPLFTVVGVVGPVRDQEMHVEAPPTLYLPQQLVAWPHMTLIVKTAGDPVAVAAAVRSEVWEVDRNVPVPEMRSLRGNLEDAVAGPRFNAQWMGFFALAALSMASMGIYGVISYSVTRRTREIGIRLAMGAHPASTMRLVLGRGLRLTAIGVVGGALGAFGLARYLEGMLFETDAVHPVTFASVALILAVVATLASYVPARRATRVDPMVALRAD